MHDSAQPLRTDHRPLYMRAIETLEAWLNEARYQPGDRLPAEGKMAKTLGISRSTLREAMGHLESQGRVIRKQGVGTFVAKVPEDLFGGAEQLESLRSRARKLGLQPKTIERQVRLVQPDATWQAQFPQRAEGQLIRVQSVEAIADQVIAYIDSYVPEERLDQESIQRFDGTVVEFLNERGAERRISHTRSDVLAIDADIDLAGMLRVPVGKSVLHLLEVYYDVNGDPIGLSKNYFLTDHYHFYIVRKVVPSS